MRRVAFWMLLALGLAGCEQRYTLEFGAPDPSASTREIWVANYRTDIDPDARQAPPRPTAPRFQKLTVSIPPTHAPGQIEWPSGEPDAATDFLTVGAQNFSSSRTFARAIAAADSSGMNEVMLFVHGYNMRPGEAVYQLAQISADFDIPTPTVLFSWPSAGVGVGYVYDRDSVLISRDWLEQLIIDLTRNPQRRILLVGHSMGSHLIMETLRQIELKRSLDIGGKIDGVILMAPDIDAELFQSQARSIRTWPDPFILMVAEQDRALRLSSLLTGFRPRLGAQTDRSAVGDLPVSVVDLSALSNGADFDHQIATTSPAAISIIRKLSEETPPGEADTGDLVVLSDLPN
ncbi:MAG: alpha/beta fold hydrolase [Pseudomonadota bacterium]